MNKKIFKIVLCLCLSLVMLITPIATSAASPYEAYTNQDTEDGKRVTIYSRDVYKAVKKLTAESLGIDDLSGITDVFAAENGKIYVLCGDQSRLFVLDKEYNFEKEIKFYDPEIEFEYDYTGAKGIFVDKNENLYLADTLNGKIVIANPEGVVEQKLGTPVSDVIPEGFFFQPTKVIKDDQGYMYVLSLGCYYGILLYSDKQEFLGYYGANEVESTVLDTLENIWQLLTSNDTKRSKQIKKLPYTTVDIVMDKEGYIYTCTGKEEVSQTVSTGQIRKISPGGSNILYSRLLDGTAESSSALNFLESKIIRRSGTVRTQNIVSLDVSDNDYIYALDAMYEKIYVYDRDCNLVTVFGGGTGEGKQLGTFSVSNSIVVNGNDVLVADEETLSITLFKLTEFGETLFKAQNLYFDSYYSEAKPYWEKVLKMDGNNRLAYRGLAKAYYYEGDTKTAIKYAKLGLDYEIYDTVHQERVKQFTKENFTWIFFGIIILVAALAFIIIKIRKREEPLIKSIKWHTFTSCFVHPFQAFNDVKYKHYGSMRIAIGTNIFFFLSVVLKNTACGFLFNKTNAQNYSILFTIAQTVGIIVLWSLANWAICSVMEGKGKLKDIYIVSSYAMVPLALYNFVYLVLSYILTLDSINIIVGLEIAIYVFVFYILAIGIMAVHEYNFPKFILTAIVALLIMILIVFIGFMVVILLQQFWNFIYSIFMEVMYR